MKFKHLLLLFILVNSFSLKSQNPIIVSMGDSVEGYVCYDGFIDHSGNYLAASSRGLPTDTFFHETLSKFDSYFGFQWSLVSDQIGAPLRVIETTDNNYLIMGFGSRGALIKIDPSGNVLWEKTYNSVYTFYDIAEFPNGDLYVTGMAYNAGCVLKLDAQGNVLWMNKYNDNLAAININPNRIMRTIDGQVAVAGYVGFSNTLPNKFFLMKISTQGNLLWSNVYQSTTTFWPYSFVQNSSDGSFIVCGNSLPPLGPNQEDGILFKADSVGNFVLAKNFYNAYGDWIYDIVQSDEGHFMAVGLTKPVINCGGNVFFAKLTSNLDTVYTKTYGNPGGTGAFFRHLKRTSDGGYYSFGGGSLWGTINQGNENIYVKTDSLMNLPCKRYAQGFFLSNLPCNSVGTMVSVTGSTTFSTTYTVRYDTLFAINSCTGVLLSTVEQPKNNAKLFPNPANDRVNVQLGNQEEGVSVEIFNATGALVYENESPFQVLEINTEAYQNGIYFYRIKTQAGLEYSGKFCVLK